MIFLRIHELLRYTNLAGSTLLSTSDTTEVLPVPTGPTSMTGWKLSTSVDTKKLYLTVSTVGTMIL